MSSTVFTKVDYDLVSLINYISLGEIGLPDIQRPFVWKNVKIRDLFDSMYKGYPVGYLLFWQNNYSEEPRTIGTEAKQKIPRLVIVDGQQLLTSLFAVVKKAEVVRKNFEKEYIHIAFNPLEEKFEVTDAAIRRDKAYLPDISVMWSKNNNLFDVVDKYITALSDYRELAEEETKKIQNSLRDRKSVV